RRRCPVCCGSRAAAATQSVPAPTTPECPPGHNVPPPASTSDGALACFFAHAAFPASSRDVIVKRSAYWDQGRTAHGRQKGSGPEWPTFAERRDERRADRFADRVVPSGAPGFGALFRLHHQPAGVGNPHLPGRPHRGAGPVGPRAASPRAPGRGADAGAVLAVSY